MSHATGDPGWDDFIRRLYAQNEFDIDFGLESMRRALAKEGHPHASHQHILVGGTNGKGGTASFLASILQAHDRRVGLYTSPHITDLRERFRVQGELPSHTDVLRVGRRILDRYGDAEDASPRLSFFEVTTLVAAVLFDDADVDVAVYEVGLGGRLDATNALEPDLSVLTNISYDHQQYLGESIEEIAGEKCGIIRADKPLVVGHQDEPAALATILEHAPEETYVYGRDYEFDGHSVLLDGQSFYVELDGLHPPTRWWNAAEALQASRAFLGADFSSDRARAGLRSTRWPGRMDMHVVGEKRILFDAAHNPAAATALFDFIGETPETDIDAVIFGAMSDKELRGMCASIPDDTPVFGSLVDSDRAADREALRRALSPREYVEIGTTDEVLQSALEHVRNGSTLLVYGSIYLIGECFDALGYGPEALVTYDISA